MAKASEPKEDPTTASMLGLSEDWPEQATDAVVNTVDKVRDVTTGPVVNFTRLLGYLVFGVFPLIIVLVLGIIAAVRGLEVATGRAWAAHGILGLVFVSLGAFAWSRRPA
ncbi:MAG: hypothetical protein F4124_15770 [Acidimicrobiia bacterium]|uniref:hypothetical protein n=1 Tax=Candidatus Poriferisocius sp. TaxID=3101276 RepID=UPI001360D601|nr:hypothetical protein [bacterium]MXW58518.1 hypothetical protein [Acidimicrobiia bacterium]MXZ84266.1 hypothetical protein [Acidimicrobiia bacterium]MYB09421.1 hypothetical protein [Acidimicrobiia bacterium]MYB73568.1 hypothetical protein [Acidimicrobiia bacterium]